MELFSMQKLLLFIPLILLFQACDNTSTMYRHGDVAQRDGNKITEKPPYKQVTYKESWVKNLSNKESHAPSATITDSEGNFYLTGGEFHSNVGDLFIEKYDSNATLLWSKKYDFGQSEEAKAITLDQNGSIYVAGYTASTHTSIDKDIIVLKVDHAGELLWHTTYGSEETDEAEGIALDSQNNVYITGNTQGALENQTAIHWHDGFLTKLSPLGKQVWTRIFGTTYSDYANFIHVDEKDDIYIGGSSSGVGNIYFTKYTTKGDEVWMKKYSTNNFDYNLKMSRGQDGYFYMSGKTSIRDENKKDITPDTEEIFIRKVDTSGDEVWYHTIGTPANNEIARSITSDKYGNIFLLISTKGNFDNDTTTDISHPLFIQLDQNGQMFSHKRYNGTIMSYANIHFNNHDEMMIIGDGHIILNESNTFGNSNVSFFLKAIPTE
jgi:hypothetical protein